MLEECAPGHSARETTHSIIVKWNGRSFPLPRGRHGRSENVKIGTSQVRTMVRQLEIDEDCAGKALPELAGCF
jgi:Mor family transcriptional regulator